MFLENKDSSRFTKLGAKIPKGALLCGPPGCGKKSLLQIAAKDVNLKVKGVYDLGHIAGGNKVRQDDLEKVISWYGGRLQKSLMGETCLLVLYGAEHLDKEGAAFVRKYDVVLIANERTESLKAHFGDRTLWANKLTEREMKQSLAILHPEARPSQVDVATRISSGDLRQAQFHITSETTNVDKAKNVYFDVHDALCKGVNKELNWHGRKWASTNHLLLERSLEEHVTLSENLLTADFIEDPENEHAAPNCIGNLADVVAGMAVKKLVGQKRSDFKLTYPPSGQRQTLKRKYPECSDDMIKYFAPPSVAEALAPQPVRRPVFPKRFPPPNVQAKGTKPRPNDQAPPPNTDSSSSPTDSSAMEDATACLAPAPTPDTSAETSLPPTVPMEEIATQELGKTSKICITEVSEVIKFMEYLRGFHGGVLVKYFVLAYFAGIRPDGELKKLSALEGEAINIDEGFIHLGAETTKDGRDRMVNISPNLKAWLEEYKDYPILPINSQKLIKAARKEFALGHDETRHSFISYHIALHRSKAEAAIQAGNSESVIQNNYHKPRAEKEGLAYFSIIPSSDGGVGSLPEEVVAATKGVKLKAI